MMKFLHVMLAITLWGLSFASCFYVTQAKKQKNPSIYPFTLRLAVKLEARVILPALTITLLTGLALVSLYDFSFVTPWIVSAYILIGIAAICRLCVLFCLAKGHITYFYYALQVLFWLILVMLVHDAVLHPMHYFWQLGVYP